MRLPRRNDIYTRRSTTSHHNPSPTVVEADTRVISWCFPTAWTLRSPDLMPWHFWLWRYLKNNIYREYLTIAFDLKNSIHCHIQNIYVDSLNKTSLLFCSVLESAIFRMECVVKYYGFHIEHVLKLWLTCQCHDLHVI